MLYKVLVRNAKDPSFERVEVSKNGVVVLTGDEYYLTLCQECNKTLSDDWRRSEPAQCNGRHDYEDKPISERGIKNYMSKPDGEKKLEGLSYQQMAGYGNTITSIATAINKTAREHGWWENGERNFGEVIALIHSEASEALEEWRNGRSVDEIWWNAPNYDKNMKGAKPEGVPIELADIVIRVFDFCAQMNIDIEQAILTKMRYNESRPYRHGNKLA